MSGFFFKPADALPTKDDDSWLYLDVDLSSRSQDIELLRLYEQYTKVVFLYYLHYQLIHAETQKNRKNQYVLFEKSSHRKK